jgi:hypothetical protein
MECKDNKDVETRKEAVMEWGTCNDWNEALMMREKRKRKRQKWQRKYTC